jgi:hypothetical protein
MKGRRKLVKIKSSGSPVPGSTSGSTSKRIKVPENTDPSLLTGETGDSNLNEIAEDETMDEDKDNLDDDFDHCLDLHFDSRVKIATSALHNVLGKESSVKW